MHSYATLGLLALAGSAVAAPRPHYGGGRHGHGGGNPQVVWETAVVTIIVGPDGQPIGGAAPTPAPEPSQGYQPAPVEPTSAVVIESPPPVSYQVPEQPSPTPAPEQPSPTPAPEQPSPTPYQPAPEPSPSPAPEPSNPPSSGGGYIDIANKWRSKMGLPNFTQDETLQNNALKTCDDGQGEMKHELNPGTFGQVLGPGKPEEFEYVFVGGWLCEMPGMAGLDGICDDPKFKDGWAHDGQTGHAKILSGDYTKLGCANAKGIWGCDVA